MSTAALLWRDWFTERIQANATNEFSRITCFLRRNGILELVIRKWIREEIAACMPKTDEIEKTIEKRRHDYEQELIGKKKETDNKNIEDLLAIKYLNKELLLQYLTNEVHSFAWAREQWKEMVPQLYLNDKDKYDIVKVSIITVGGKENKLLNEIYHAINNNEYTLEEAFKIYKERVKGTSNGPTKMKLNEIKPQLKQVIKESKINRISRPFKIDGRMAMIKVMEVEESGLTEMIENDIIEKQLSEFLDYGVVKVCEYLTTNR